MASLRPSAEGQGFGRITGIFECAAGNHCRSNRKGFHVTTRRFSNVPASLLLALNITVGCLSVPLCDSCAVLVCAAEGCPKPLWRDSGRQDRVYLASSYRVGLVQLDRRILDGKDYNGEPACLCYEHALNYKKYKDASGFQCQSTSCVYKGKKALGKKRARSLASTIHDA